METLSILLANPTDPALDMSNYVTYRELLHLIVLNLVIFISGVVTVVSAHSKLKEQMKNQLEREDELKAAMDKANEGITAIREALISKGILKAGEN